MSEDSPQDAPPEAAEASPLAAELEQARAELEALRAERAEANATSEANALTGKYAWLPQQLASSLVAHVPADQRQAVIDSIADVVSRAGRSMSVGKGGLVPDPPQQETKTWAGLFRRNK